MSFNSIGDLAQSIAWRRQSSALQTRMSQLTQELTTGQSADITRHLQGGFHHLADIENQLTLNASYKGAASEAGIFTATMQGALDHVHTQLTDLSGAALLAANTTGGGLIEATAEQAQLALGAIVSALNTDVAGRPLFSGTELDTVPLATPKALLDAARAAISGATDAATAAADLDTFFMTSGAGFDTLVYQGGDGDLSPYRLGAGEEVTLSIRADDPILRAALRDTVMTVLAADDALALNGAARQDLLDRASDGLLSQIDGVTRLRSDLGFAEARIEQIAARIAAETTSLTMARNQLLSVDPFETASALEQTQLQLETLYTITARTSRLNLVNFL